MTTPATPATTAPALSDSQKRSKAYAQAEKALRLAHSEEFQDLHEEASKALGLPFKRKLTKQEKARAEILKLAAENEIDLDKLTDELAIQADNERAASLRPPVVE